jgi:hypothetical protein
VAVSSTVNDKRNFPSHLVDGRLGTAWNSRPGDLVGAWISFRVPIEYRVTSIRITPGFAKRTRNKDRFRMNYRIQRVRVDRNGLLIGIYNLNSSRRALQRIRFRREQPGGDFKVTIVKVVPGTMRKWREICVSEFQAWGYVPPGARGLATPKILVGTLDPAQLSSVEAPHVEFSQQKERITNARAKLWLTFIGGVVLVIFLLFLAGAASERYQRPHSFLLPIFAVLVALAVYLGSWALFGYYIRDATQPTLVTGPSSIPMAILEFIGLLAALAWWSPVLFIYGIWALCTGKMAVGIICLLSGALPFWIFSMLLRGGSTAGSGSGGGGGGGSIGFWLTAKVKKASGILQVPKSRGHLNSRRYRDIVVSEVDAARPCDLFGFDPPDRDEMKALGQQLEKGIKLLRESGNEMTFDDKKECQEAIQTVQASHQSWEELHRRQHEKSPSDRRAYLEHKIEENRMQYVKKAEDLAHTRAHADELRSEIAAGRHLNENAGAVNQLLGLEHKIEDIEAKLRKMESCFEDDEKALSLLRSRPKEH